MKKIVKKPDICLFTIALAFSKHTGSVITILYGDVFIEFSGRKLCLRFSEKDKFEFFSKNDVNDIQYWMFFIPISKIMFEEEIFEYLSTILNCSLFEESITPKISVPSNYYKVISNKKILCLDSFFTLTEEKNTYYKIIKEKNIFIFSIVLNNEEVYSCSIDILLRDGEGNTDL